MKEYFVYILSNKRRTAIYIGVTYSLTRRSLEHLAKQNPNSFTARYNLDELLYYELFASRNDAIAREKQLKKWGREKKNELIKLQNPEMKNLLVD